MKKKLLGLLPLFILLLASCSPTGTVPAGIQVSDVTVAVGGAEGNVEQQVVTYHITLQNNTQNDLLVEWVEPVLNETISGKLVGESPRVQVNQTLSAHGTLAVEGQFTFEAGGASKSEISGWEPFFDTIRIANELDLSVPGKVGNP